MKLSESHQGSASKWTAIFGAAALTALTAFGLTTAIPAKAAVISVSQCNDWICTSVKLDGYRGHNVTNVTVRTKKALQGHFEVFGPGGHIANSETRSWQKDEMYGVEGFWHGNTGDLWCGRFWIYQNGAYRNVSGNVCVKG
jgi:hypothetical protein